MGTGSFSGRGVDHPPQSSVEVEGRVELLPLWAFVAFSRVTFTFTYIAPDLDPFLSQHVARLNESLFCGKFVAVFLKTFHLVGISDIVHVPQFVNLPCLSRHLVTAPDIYGIQ
jgi:hypothetical protein